MLMHLCFHISREMLQMLFSYGARYDATGGLEKWTSLFFAALSGHPDCVCFLLMTGLDKNYCDARGLLCVDHVERLLNALMGKLNYADNSPAGETIEMLVSLSGNHNHQTCFLSCMCMVVIFLTDEMQVEFHLHELSQTNHCI